MLYFTAFVPVIVMCHFW